MSFNVAREKSAFITVILMKWTWSGKLFRFSSSKARGLFHLQSTLITYELGLQRVQLFLIKSSVIYFEALMYLEIAISLRILTEITFL